MKAVKDKSAVEQFKKHMEEILAQSYAQQRSETVRRGMKSMVLQGYLPAQPPLGYKKTMVKGLYRPTKLGKAMSNILRRLGNGNITITEAMLQLKLLIETKTGRKVSADRLIRLMSNPYYAGMLCCQGKQYLGKHAALVTSEQHEAVLQSLRSLPEISKGN